MPAKRRVSVSRIATPKTDYSEDDLVKTQPIHSKSIHVQLRDSPLAAHQPLDYKGFRNLVVLLLVASNLRLVIENYLKYGFLIMKSQSDASWTKRDLLWSVGLCAMVIGSGFVALLFEKMCVPAKGKKPAAWVEYALSLLHFLNIVCMFVTMISCVYHEIQDPALATLPCVVGMAAILKTASFILVNGELRQNYVAGSNANSDGPNDYPNNLTVSSVIRLMCVPTLCYQTQYPSTPTIRWKFVAKRVLEMVLIGSLVHLLYVQYEKPILDNFIRMEQHDSWSFSLQLLERLLKLSVPSIAVWLLLFYMVFHSYLNFWAELFQFGDREFYSPWWNATTISEYWRLWNIPVYQWVKRHVNLPLRAKGYPRWVAHLIAFTISAVGHEIIIGVPLKVGVDFIFNRNSQSNNTGSMWAFWAMVAQVPLIFLTETLQWLELKYMDPQQESPEDLDDKNSLNSPVIETADRQMNKVVATMKVKRKGMLGNWFFWVSFCIVGQPLIVMLYYRAYWLRIHPKV